MKRINFIGSHQIDLAVYTALLVSALGQKVLLIDRTDRNELIDYIPDDCDIDFRRMIYHYLGVDMTMFPTPKCDDYDVVIRMYGYEAPTSLRGLNIISAAENLHSYNKLKKLSWELEPVVEENDDRDEDKTLAEIVEESKKQKKKKELTENAQTMLVIRNYLGHVPYTALKNKFNPIKIHTLYYNGRDEYTYLHFQTDFQFKLNKLSKEMCGTVSGIVAASLTEESGKTIAKAMDRLKKGGIRA